MITEFKIQSYDPQWTISKRAARGCYLSKLLYVSDGSGIYSRDCPECYVGDNAFHQTVDSAKAYASCLENRGTPCYIDEVPALVFHISSWCFVVTEINTAFPFEYFLENKPMSKSIEDIALYFSPRRMNTLQRLFGVYNEFTRPATFRSFCSNKITRNGKRDWHQQSSNIHAIEIKYAEMNVNRLHRWITAQQSK